MQAQIDAIKARVQQCIAAAEAKFGITMPQVQVRFDLTGRAAGMAGYTRSWTGANSNFYLRFNVKHMQMGGQTWEHLLNDTVPHEVAHTVCQAFPKFGRNHDAGWKRVCLALGGNGRRTYSEDDAPEAVAAQRPYVYITTNGHEVRVTKVIHSKIQTRDASYRYKGNKGTINKQCQYSYMAAPAVAASRKPVVVQQPAPVAPKPVVSQLVHSGSSNAERVRAYIANAKAAHGSEAYEMAVSHAVNVLGMKPALARTYVKNNWNKV